MRRIKAVRDMNSSCPLLPAPQPVTAIPTWCRSLFSLLSGTVFSAVLLSGCVKPPEPEAIPSEQQATVETEGNYLYLQPVKLTSKHLPNPIRIHDKVISGGLPANEAAFGELTELGVRTIISVDGAKPDVEMAGKYHMRYVHLPHGYDGISEQRVMELAKAVRELEGPIYIHCHHGKHRSPAAAGVACVAAGLIPASQSLAILQVAGTNPGYRGLFQAAERVRPLESSLLDELQVEFREIIEVPPMAEAMVDLEHVLDRLTWVEAAGWSVPKDQPDIEPDHEALLMREHFTELLRTAEVKEYAVGFAELLRESERAAESLHAALVKRAAAPLAPVGVTEETNATNSMALKESIEVNWKTIVVGCKGCHEAYRDVPLSERSRGN